MKKQKNIQSRVNRKLSEMSVRKSYKAVFKRDWQLYFMIFFALVFVIIFKYAAYPGLRISFMDYKPAKGFAGSEWVGWQTFAKVFKDKDFIKALKNSLIFNILELCISFPVPIILAIMLNELRVKWFKKLSQTILYLPHFLSWVIIGSVSLSLFKPDTGLVNIILVNSKMIESGIPFITEKWHWAVTYLVLGVWQGMGWGTIIYLAAITGISPDLYEAATMDGASRFRQIRHITLPGIKPTAVTLLIMNLGKVMGSNYERLDSLGTIQSKDFSYQLAIYIYEKGLAGMNFSRATAVGLFQSLVGLILVLLADRFAKKLGEEGLI